jgi:acyl carrier protein phosphodiesterase
MNWLAHLLLADPDTDFRIAAILPDFMDATVLNALPVQFQPEIQRHRAIDAFTDEYPAFRRSVSRLNPPFRRYGGIVVDVFYDHFITTNWAEYLPLSLDEFLNTVALSFQRCRDWLPDDTVQNLQRVLGESWLSSYGELHGVGNALSRIGRRFKRHFDLSPCVTQLDEHYKLYSDDFEEFFDALLAHLKTGPKSCKPLLHLA